MMKNVLFLSVLLALTSCKKEATEDPVQDPTTETYSEGHSAEAKTPEALGKQIFEGPGNCTSCHQADQKVIGPSIKEIAKIYKDKNGNMVDFLKGESEAIVDPSQFAVMQANLEITKTFTEDELKAVEAYMNSHLK